jgi:hypothetical protein
MGWFKRKANVPFNIDMIDVSIQSLPMHILALDPRTGQGPLNNRLKGSPTYFLPTIVRDGLFSLLSVPSEKILFELLKGVRSRVLELPKTTVSYMGVTTGIGLDPSKPAIDALPYEVIGFSQASPELEKIFHTLQLPISFPNNPSLGLSLLEEAIKELQKEPMRTWINRTLENLEHELNWTESIAYQVEELKRQHGLG